ncbi:MAG: AAA family ATPase [Lewinella sp.]
MITRIEISGFKSFTDFAVDFAPLTVIAGANASGKSNLLDALRVLKGLAEGQSLGETIYNRGSGIDLFTKYGKKTTAEKMTIAVELLLPKEIVHKRRVERLAATRMRYEITITRPKPEDVEYFEVDTEHLRFIERAEDDYFTRLSSTPSATNYFMYAANDTKEIINYDVREYRINVGEHFNLDDHKELLGESILSNRDQDVDLHVTAVREILTNLNPVDLISPDNFSDQGSEGRYRKGTNGTILSLLSTLKKYQPEDIKYLSKRVRQIVKDIVEVDIFVDPFGRSSVTATDERGARFLAESLSEGTLRVLALASYLTLDIPDQTLLLEEPENGVDPRVLGKILDLLLDLSTDFSESTDELRQVICTTHSAHLLELVLERRKSNNIKALLATKLTLTGGKYRNFGGVSTTRMFEIYPEVALSKVKDPVARVTFKQAMEYLRGSLPNKELLDA